MTTAGAEPDGDRAAVEAAACTGGHMSWAAKSRRRRQAEEAECNNAGLLGSKPNTVVIKESSLSGDGRAWPSNPKVVNPAAAHCWSRADKAAGSSRRCDMLAGAYVKARPLGTASSESKKWLPDNNFKIGSRPE